MIRLCLATLLVIFAGDVHAFSRKAPAPTPAPVVSPSPEPSPTGTPEPHVGFKCVECTPSEVGKVAAAERYLDKLVPSAFFSDFLGKRGMIWTNGKTDPQVIAHIRAANLTVPVHYYRGKCSVVGYRLTSAPDIYFNRCHHDSYDEVDTASNGLHEWSHTLGYDHPVNRTGTRGLTVPYSMNAVVEASENQPKPGIMSAKVSVKRGHGYRGELLVVTPEQAKALR